MCTLCILFTSIHTTKHIDLFSNYNTMKENDEDSNSILRSLEIEVDRVVKECREFTMYNRQTSIDFNFYRTCKPEITVLTTIINHFTFIYVLDYIH